jgi:hypothetical protein
MAAEVLVMLVVVYFFLARRIKKISSNQNTPEGFF